MPDEKIFQLKAELRKMTKGNLLKMALSQKEKKLPIGRGMSFSF